MGEEFRRDVPFALRRVDDVPALVGVVLVVQVQRRQPPVGIALAALCRRAQLAGLLVVGNGDVVDVLLAEITRLLNVDLPL